MTLAHFDLATSFPLGSMQLIFNLSFYILYIQYESSAVSKRRRGREGGGGRDAPQAGLAFKLWAAADRSKELAEMCKPRKVLQRQVLGQQRLW